MFELFLDAIDFYDMEKNIETFFKIAPFMFRRWKKLIKVCNKDRIFIFKWTILFSFYEELLHFTQLKIPFCAYVTLIWQDFNFGIKIYL